MIISSKTKTSSSRTRAKKPAEKIATESDEDTEHRTKRLKINKYGYVVTQTGRISMKHMTIAQEISSTRPYEGALPHPGFNVNFGQAFSLFTLVKCGPFVPVEMNRDDNIRKQIFAAASPYALGPQQIKVYNESDPLEQKTARLGWAKAYQQRKYVYVESYFCDYTEQTDHMNNTDYFFNRYNMIGHIHNVFNDKVATREGLQPIQKVKDVMGLVGEHAAKSFMQM